MTVDESKKLKKGTRVYWRGDAADSGIVTETSWDAVTIAWNNGQVASVHHGDMRNSAGADKAASRDKGSIMTRAPSVSDFALHRLAFRNPKPRSSIAHLLRLSPQAVGVA